MIEKNDLIDVFSSSMGNSEKKFIEDFAIGRGISNYKEMIEEFTSIQNQVYDYVFKITEPNLQLSSQEIESISLDFCKSKIEWINSKGIKGCESLVDLDVLA